MVAFCLPWRFMLKAFGAKTFNTPNSADQPESRLALPQNAGAVARAACLHIFQKIPPYLTIRR